MLEKSSALNNSVDVVLQLAKDMPKFLELKNHQNPFYLLHYLISDFYARARIYRQLR